MHAESAPMAFHQNLEVSSRLRRFHDAESVFLTGHRQIHRIVTGYLQEDAGVGASLVGLAGGVEETRTESETGGYMTRVADHGPHLLKNLLVGIIHFDIGEESEIIACAQAAQMGFEVSGEGRILA